MTLSKESKDAFLQCVRIIGSRSTPAEKNQHIKNFETYKQKGEWIPALKIKHIAQLFYPYNITLELAMLQKMEKAFKNKDLNSILLPSELSAWHDCPPVPQNSPLRYWLPDWMQASALPATLATQPDGEARLSVMQADIQRETAAERAPLPLTSKQIAFAFDGIYDLNEKRWSNKLSDVKNASWLQPARVHRGTAPNPSTWNPVKLANALQEKGVSEETLNRLFLRMPTLKPWLPSWQETTRASNGFGR